LPQRASSLQPSGIWGGTMTFPGCNIFSKMVGRTTARASAIGADKSGSRIGSVLHAAALCMALAAGFAVPGHAAPLDDAAERYRPYLIQDIDRALMSARELRACLIAGDLAGAKRAWVDARVGWERSEVFTSGFVPELDREIDAWPNALQGFHAIEAKLFGANRTDIEDEANALMLRLEELSTTVRVIKLTPQALLNGIARLAYEVGESKVDGGESRVSGTSVDDMRHNMDGIELAYRTIFAPAIEANDPALAAAVQHKIDELKAMLDPPALKRLDPDKLREVSEEIVLGLQNAAPRIALQKPSLEESGQ